MNPRSYYILSTYYVPCSVVNTLFKHVIYSSQACETSPTIIPTFQMRKMSQRDQAGKGQTWDLNPCVSDILRSS